MKALFDCAVKVLLEFLFITALFFRPLIKEDAHCSRDSCHSRDNRQNFDQCTGSFFHDNDLRFIAFRKLWLRTGTAYSKGLQTPLPGNPPVILMITHNEGGSQGERQKKQAVFPEKNELLSLQNS
jgi:hypothetical protein